MLININAKLVKLTQNRRKILAELILMFKLIDIQIVISRKVINDISNDLYEKLLRSMKFLIKKLQTKDQWMRKFHVRKFVSSCRLRKRFKNWIIDDENLVKRNECLYVSSDIIVKEKLIKKHHNNLLSRYFKAQKTLNLIQRKYHWIVYSKQIKTYVKIYNIC